MSKKASRRQDDPVAQAAAAMERAADAMDAGDAAGAERWTRVAERFANAPRPTQTMEDVEAIREELRARLARYAEADLEEKKRLSECDRAWEIAIWNELRAGLGLEALPFDPCPINRDLIALLYGRADTTKIY